MDHPITSQFLTHNDLVDQFGHQIPVKNAFIIIIIIIECHWLMIYNSLLFCQNLQHRLSLSTMFVKYPDLHSPRCSIQILLLPNVSISVNIILNLFIIHSPVQKYLTPQQKLIFSNTYKSKLFTPINKYSLCFSLVI